MTPYTLYTNLDASYVRPYEPGDRLVKGWTGTVDLNPGVYSLDYIYDRHNRDDRPDGRLAPSLSVGDVIVVGTDPWATAWSVDSFGFTPVELDPADLIVDRTWKQVVNADA